MGESAPSSEFLVLSRGRWDEDATAERIETAIDAFYAWLDREVAAGRMKTGQRLATGGRTVGRDFVSDGPFGESKEIIGGYWFIIARDLDEAQAIIAGNPCMALGLFFELRPVETARASAYAVTNETPLRRP
ncbi:MAG TPA: YciI family protein [Dokdonella sp.]